LHQLSKSHGDGTPSLAGRSASQVIIWSMPARSINSCCPITYQDIIRVMIA
jgi:hypothetical protein